MGKKIELDAETASVAVRLLDPIVADDRQAMETRAALKGLCDVIRAQLGAPVSAAVPTGNPSVVAVPDDWLRAEGLTNRDRLFEGEVKGKVLNGHGPGLPEGFTKFVEVVKLELQDGPIPAGTKFWVEFYFGDTPAVGFFLQPGNEARIVGQTLSTGKPLEKPLEIVGLEVWHVRVEAVDASRRRIEARVSVTLLGQLLAPAPVLTAAEAMVNKVLSEGVIIPSFTPPTVPAEAAAAP